MVRAAIVDSAGGVIPHAHWLRFSADLAMASWEIRMTTST